MFQKATIIMPKTKPTRTHLCLSFLASFVFSLSYSQDTPPSASTTAPVQDLKTLFNTALPSSMPERIEYFSRVLLGQPYVLGALGEGQHGVYDISPLYRFDGFDCETFVDTVLALALSDNAKAFEQCINRIRYENGIVSFSTRNHFTSLDWNPNNQQQRFVKDITQKLEDAKGKPVYALAKAVIDKPKWYRKLSQNRLKLTTTDPKILHAKLLALRQEGNRFKPAEATIPYIPLTALFHQDGEANMRLFQQIPNAAIVEIVRPNWNLTKQAGTHLNVSHLGFVFWQGKHILFREASSVHQKTVDVDFISYLRSYLESPTIKGINIQVVLPKAPLPSTCKVTSQNTNQLR